MRRRIWASGNLTRSTASCNNFIISSTFNWDPMISIIPVAITNIRSNFVWTYVSLAATIDNTEPITFQSSPFLRIQKNTFLYKCTGSHPVTRNGAPQTGNPKGTYNRPDLRNTGNILLGSQPI